MSPLRLNGSDSGYSQLEAPAIAGDQTFTLPGTGGTFVTTDGTQTLTNKTIQGGAITSGTAVASTSGTAIDFTGIPSWVKRITVMFDGVSTTGTSNYIVQLGDSGGIETSGYLSYTKKLSSTTLSSSGLFSAGIGLTNGPTSTNPANAQIFITQISGNSWIVTFTLGLTDGDTMHLASGSKTLSETLDRIRITTSLGTDTFDAGTINILYE